MLNVENIRRVRDLIAAEPDRLDMTTFISRSTDDVPRLKECGTAACIAGWAASLAGIRPSSDPNAIMTVAAQFLGLGPITTWEYNTPADNELALKLFFGPYEGEALELATPEMVVDVLDTLIETGEVRWPDNFGEEEEDEG